MHDGARFLFARMCKTGYHYTLKLTQVSMKIIIFFFKQHGWLCMDIALFCFLLFKLIKITLEANIFLYFLNVLVLKGHLIVYCFLLYMCLGLCFLWFYVQELPKAQLAVVLVLKRLRRRGIGLKPHPTNWEKPGIEPATPGFQEICYPLHHGGFCFNMCDPSRKKVRVGWTTSF